MNTASESAGRRWVFARTLVVVYLVLAWNPCGTDVRAEGLPDGVYHVVKLPSVAGSFAGFNTSVGFSDFTSVGYQPVEIKFNAAVAAKADVRLTYRITSMAGYQSPGDNGLVVDIPIFVPEGTKSAVWIRYLPKWMTGFGFEVSVRQDDRILKGYSGLTYRSARRRQYFDWQVEAGSELTMDWLLVTPDLVLSQKDRQALPSLLSADWRVAVDVPLVGFNMSSRILACGQKDLPDDWRGYQRWDVVVMGKQAIDRLKQRDGEWKALLGWIVNGGTMVVWDAQSQAELALLFDRSADVLQPSPEACMAMGFTESGLMSLGLVKSVSSKVKSGVVPTAAQGAEKVWGDRPLWAVGLGAGRAIAIGNLGDDEKSFDNPVKWDFFSTLLQQQTSATLRRGGDPILGNSSFWRWAVLGVSEPPVYVLIALLTVFVILVGPVAYRRMARQGRSHLMFVIAPVLALLTTVIMFGYGIAADGFSPIARIRQLTWVDGASGDAGERVLATYFAPIRPRGGLTFPGDAEVVGIRRPDHKSWNERHQLSGEPLGTVVVTEDSQRFSSSFLPSREQRQFVTHRPRFGIGRLRLQQSTGLIAASKVINEFGFQLKDAILRDRQGVYWHVMNLESGGTAQAEKLGSEAASVVLGKYYLDNRPLAVRGQGNSSNAYRNFYNTDVYDFMSLLEGSVVNAANTRHPVTDGFESWLQRHLQSQSEIPEGYFVAISDVEEDVSALKGCVLQDSVRYVFGTLP